MILSGNPPFDGDDDTEIENKVLQGSFNFEDSIWNSISENGKDFITKLLTFEQSDRPTAEEALKHPWFKELSPIQIDESVA